MTRRFPLYAKILCLFLLNLLLLVLFLFIVSVGELRFGIDWLVSPRVDSVKEFISEELQGEPQSMWDDSLARFAKNYQDKVQFLAVSGNGAILAGQSIIIPSEVQEQLGHRHGPPPVRMGEENPRPPHEPPPGPAGPPKRFVHTTNPSRYWVIMRTMLRDTDRAQPTPLILVAVSESFAGNGLFFNTTMWLVQGFEVLFLSVFIWFPFMRDLTRAVAQIRSATEEIAQGRFDVRLKEDRRDELGSLAQAINRMAARLNDLVNGQKRFLGDVAHELVSPLAKLRVSLGILDQQVAEEQKNYVAGAEEEAAHMAEMINELLSFSKASLTESKLRLGSIPVREVVESAVLREAVPAERVNIAIPDNLWVMADGKLLARALSNLLRNAVRYAGEAGPITISAQSSEKHVLITVADSGPGVPETELTRIFDPFYRVDSSRDRTTGGAGLGLAIVKTCIESCGGTVTGRNRQTSGLEVTVRLPEAP